MDIRKGKIMGFSGSWSSGIGYLNIRREDGIVESIPCENAPTVRALDSAFGDVITKAHTVNQKAIKGKNIYYSVGDFGLLEGFTPVDEASAELKRAYRKSKEKLHKEVL